MSTFGNGVAALNAKAKLTSTSGLTPVTLVTAGGSGAKLITLYMVELFGTPLVPVGSTPTVQLSILNNGISYFLGQTAILASEGKTSIQGQVNLLNQAAASANNPFAGLPTDENGLPYLPLGNGDQLQIAATTALSSGYEIDIIGLGMQYQ